MVVVGRGGGEERGIHEATSAVSACVLVCRVLSWMGDGFSLFNFSFFLCGIPELFEIDHPLIS